MILIIWTTISIVSLSVAGDQKTSKENDVCSLLNTSRLSALIGAGGIVSTVRGSDCKYEHPEASDSLVPPGEADLSVLDHSPNEAKSNFEDDLKGAVKNIREGSVARLFLVERGKDYAAYSNESQARVVHDGRIVILDIVSPGEKR